MSTPILHHYDLSPFGEKVRLAFGHKGLAWSSVEIPIWPPRPDTVPLTAGYRRAPVLQIGADIYCDTLLILAELERRYPEPTLYPAGMRGQAMALGAWAEATGFMPAATLTTAVIGDGIPADFIADRIAFMRHDFSRAASLKTLPLNRQRVAAFTAMLAAMLADGRPFLLGDRLSAADLAAYHPLWFARSNGGAEVRAMLPLGGLEDWMARMAAIGHGTRSSMTPGEALRVAREATPLPATGVAAGDPCGLAAGARVLVRADAANDPIRGILVGADAEAIVIRHESEAAGIVHVHLPRLGYGAVSDEAA